LQNLRTNIEYTVDSLLLFKFGSIEKYKELLQEEAEAVSIWMETPKTAKDAYQFLKNDCETYLSCYPEDTITAVLMFIDDVATSASLSITQKNALEYKIISENNITKYHLFYSSIYIYDIYLKGLEFSYVLGSILTKQQMETYLKHYKKQQSVRSTIRDALFPSVRINSGVFVPEYRLHWNNYVANKDKYKDEQDFLRKEVFKKSYKVPQFTKEGAIAIIKANYLYMNFRYPEDTIANINRFIDNINEIVPLDREKRDKIKVLILSEIKQKEKTISVNHLLSSDGWFDLPDFIFIMGINANDIIKDCFNSSDYKKIYYKLSKDKTNARKAYYYLSRQYSYETREIYFNNWANPRGFINFIFEYYGI
jgi:hypothetical protein